MADVGLHALEYEMASSPSESILARPMAQFPFNIMEIKESVPRYLRQGVSIAEAVVGSPDLSQRLGKQPFVATVNEEFLDHVKFNGDDSAGALKLFAHRNKLFVFSKRAYKDDDDQARYAKSASKVPLKWSGRITELLRLCSKVQDRFVNAGLQCEEPRMD